MCIRGRGWSSRWSATGGLMPVGWHSLFCFFLIAVADFELPGILIAILLWNSSCVSNYNIIWGNLLYRVTRPVKTTPRPCETVAHRQDSIGSFKPFARNKLERERSFWFRM